MEAAFHWTAEHLHFQSPRIYHSVAVLVLGLAYYSKNPDGVGDAINIFMFPDLLPLAGSEAALLLRRWDAILGGSALNFFTDTNILMSKQQVEPFKS